MSSEEKVEFHQLLLKSLSELDSRTPFGLNLYTAVKKFGRGIASGGTCIYGGWVSTVKSGVCGHPYRGSPDYEACGLKGVHRCNPVIFGESSEKKLSGTKPGKGACIKAEGDSSSMTWSCLKAAYGDSDGNIDIEQFRKHLKNIGGNSRYLGEYLAQATEIIENHCSKNSDEFCFENASESSCQRLKNSFFEKTSANPALIGCRQQHEILLEDAKNSLESNRKILEIYFPLIEESQGWKKIKEMKMVAEILKDESFWSYRCNPYDIIENNRLSLKKLGRKSCLAKKNMLENKVINHTPWGAMSLGERAEKISKLAKDSYADIKAHTKKNISKSGVFNPVEKANGNVFHKDITPDVAACFIYHETKGSLHPFKYNYTYCNKVTRSSAFGLGQITRSTLKDIVDTNNGSNLPLVTPEAKKFYWPGYSEEPMDGEDIYRYMSFSPKFQVELVMRILNRKAKVANSYYGDKYSLKSLVGAYYGCDRTKAFCQKSIKKYFDDIESCVKCFGGGGLASNCYYVLEKCQSQDCKEAKRTGRFSP